MAKVMCDGCNEAVNLPKLKRNVLQHLVYEYYWLCPSCNHKHISYYTDKKIRQSINRLTKKRKQWQQSKTDEESRRRLSQINLENKVIKQDMDALKEKMWEVAT